MGTSSKLGTSAVAEITIAPEVGARVSAILSTYHGLQEQVEILESLMEEEKQKVHALMVEAGVKKIVVDGAPCNIVEKMSSSLDKVKFVELGGSLKQLEEATVHKPVKPYVTIGKRPKK